MIFARTQLYLPRMQLSILRSIQSLFGRATYATAATKNPSKKTLKNAEIASHYPLIQLIDLQSQRHAATSTASILAALDTTRYDLQLVNTSVDPPIAKVVDRAQEISKARTQKSAAALQKRLAMARSVGKEVQFGTSITAHDFGTKMAKVAELLRKGFRVRFVIEPKGVMARQAGQKEQMHARIVQCLEAEGICFEVVEPAQLLSNRLTFALLSLNSE